MEQKDAEAIGEAVARHVEIRLVRIAQACQALIAAQEKTTETREDAAPRLAREAREEIALLRARLERVEGDLAALHGGRG